MMIFSASNRSERMKSGNPPCGKRRRQTPFRFILEGLEQRSLLSITPSFGQISAAEGTPFSGVVATFTTDDPGPPALSSFSATINWGDGTMSAGTVSTEPGGGYEVTGTHDYVEEATLTASVTITDGVSSPPAVTGQARVFDAPLTISAVSVTATQGTAFSGEVATFTDRNPGAATSDFTSTINWGDGTTSAGSISVVAGKFQVAGAHDYASPGQFPVIVAVQDAQSFATTGFGNQTNLVSPRHPGPRHLNTTQNPGQSTGPRPDGRVLRIADNGTRRPACDARTTRRGHRTRLQSVTVPPPGGQAGPSAPTGIVSNGNSSEFLVASGKQALFLFDTEDGTISAWNPAGPAGLTHASLEVDNSQVANANGSTGAVYKGLAVASQGGTNNDFLYATNFRSGNIDVFNKNFQAAGSFTDTSLTSLGFAPFGIQNIGGNLYVSFAKQDAEKHDDVAGAGNGFIDEFSPEGTMIRRLASNGAAPTRLGHSPWRPMGLANSRVTCWWGTSATARSMPIT